MTEPPQPSSRALSVRGALKPLLEALASKPETAGVCVLGSFALSGIRPNADIYSDFDIAVIIDIPVADNFLHLPMLEFQAAIQPSLPLWLPNFKFHYPHADPDGKTDGPRLQINVHQLVLAYEAQPLKIWPPDRREAFANTCDVVYDRDGAVRRLIAAKSPPPLAELRQRVSDDLALIPVTLEHSMEKCAWRNTLADAHLALAETVILMIDLLYALNVRDVPHQKWRLKMLETLPILPGDFYTRVSSLLLDNGATKEGVLLSLAKARALFEEVKSLVPGQLRPEGDPYRYLIARVRPGFQLRQDTSADRFADTSLPQGCDQYDRMANQDWNRINFELIPDGEQS